MRRLSLALVVLAGCARSAEAPPPSAPAVSYGAAMADVARRFELLGRAAQGGRYALASYELGEIGEVFEGTLPKAALPKEGGEVSVIPIIGSVSLQEWRELAGRIFAVLAYHRVGCRLCWVVGGRVP